MGKYVMKTTKTGIRFDLLAANGQIIASSQTYKAELNCRKGIASVKRNAQRAYLENQTEEGYERKGCPKFEVYTDKAGEFRFRLKAKNGQVVAVSEGYTTLKNCLNGVESVRKNSVTDVIEKV